MWKLTALSKNADCLVRLPKVRRRLACFLGEEQLTFLLLELEVFGNWLCSFSVDLCSFVA